MNLKDIVEAEQRYSGSMVRRYNKITGLFKNNALHLLVKTQGTYSPERFDQAVQNKLNFRSVIFLL